MASALFTTGPQLFKSIPSLMVLLKNEHIMTFKNIPLALAPLAPYINKKTNQKTTHVHAQT